MTTIDQLQVEDGYAAVHLDGRDERGRCLLVPPFGVPASALQLLADALQADGVATARLDPRNHVGLGTGEIVDFRLSDFVADCREAVECYRPSIVVAVSMGARAAMRALTTVTDGPDAVFLIPVVDVRTTLATILDRDWFAADAAELPDRISVLGSDVDAASFRRDCIRHELVGVDGTRRDLGRLDGRVVLLPGTDDPWVQRPMVEQLVDSLAGVAGVAGSLAIRPVRCDRHDLHADPELALALMGTVLDEVRALLPPTPGLGR